MFKGNPRQHEAEANSVMTFSIVGFDRNSGDFGVAITTSSIAVGSRCPWVRAGVGAVATQNITDPSLGPAVLDLLQSGLGAKDALAQVMAEQPFMDFRQLTIVDKNGEIAEFTGKNILGTHAVAYGDCCVAAGNLLANTRVPSAMVDHFESRQTGIHIAEALLGAIKAGLDAGGELGEVHSAALLTASEFSWPEVNLRIDWHDTEPVKQLESLWKAYAPQRVDYNNRAVNPDAAPSYGVPGDP